MLGLLPGQAGPGPADVRVAETLSDGSQRLGWPGPSRH